MSREVHVRFREGVGVRLTCATRLRTFESREKGGSKVKSKTFKKRLGPLCTAIEFSFRATYGEAEPKNHMECRSWRICFPGALADMVGTFSANAGLPPAPFAGADPSGP